MNECLTLRLGADLAVLLREMMDAVSGSVVLDDSRVVDGDVGCLLVEIIDRVAALAHHLSHEPVRVAHCARRMVAECCAWLEPHPVQRYLRTGVLVGHPVVGHTRTHRPTPGDTQPHQNENLGYANPGAPNITLQRREHKAGKPELSLRDWHVNGAVATEMSYVTRNSDRLAGVLVRRITDAGGDAVAKGNRLSRRQRA
jgi:hypothetical protein